MFDALSNMNVKTYLLGKAQRLLIGMIVIQSVGKWKCGLAHKTTECSRE